MNERVRVLIDYRSALRYRTGVGQYIHQLAQALAAPEIRDCSVTLFTSSWKDRPDLSSFPASLSVIDRRVPVRLLNFLWHRFEWPLVERLTGHRFDVVHSAHPLLMPSAEAAQIVMIHDLDFLDHPERMRAEIRRDYPVLARAHAARADAVITVSEYTARRVAERLGVDRSKIAVCPGGAPPWPPRNTLPIDGHILFVGTLESRKNVGVLLAAYEQLLRGHPHAPPLVLAGKATADARPWLEALTRPPLVDRVRYVGYVPAEQQRTLYENALVLAAPSLEEGFGFPALEAMTVGVPVVASTRGAFPEVVGDAGLLVAPDRPDLVAEALARALFDRSAAEEMVVRGFARARRFSWIATAHAVRAAYDMAVERRRQR